MENHGTRNTSETAELVYTHIKTLKNRPCFRYAQITFIPESNLAGEANGVSEYMLRAFDGIRVLAQAQDRYGCPTTQDTKRKYCFRFQEILAHGAIAFHKNVVSANPFISNVTDAERAKRSRKEFEHQLRSFRKIHVLAPSIQSDPYVVFSGKVGPDNKNTSRMKDDLVMACLVGIYWSGQFRQGLVRYRTSERALQRELGRTVAPITRHVSDGGAEYQERAEQLERTYAVVPDAVKRRPSVAEQLRTVSTSAEAQQAKRPRA